MRIAMLQSSLPPSPRSGGVGYQVDLLARELTRRGDDVTVFVADEVPAHSSYPCEAVMTGTGRVARLLGVGWRFARLDLSGFDVVHAHGDDWLFGRRARVRTFYGSALMEARTATSRLRAGSQLCYYGLEWISTFNPVTVAISDRTRRYLPLVRQCIPCAYDPTVFFPGGTRHDEPSILFVAGTLQGRKRGSLLVEAFAAVQAEVPDARLTIVSREGVARPGVTCLSDVSPSSLGELYRSHWLLCSTSSYEGFGVPYVEAMASGLPVVATANDGAREVLRDGDLGVVCTPEVLAREVIRLIRDPTRRDALAGAGVRAAHRYSIDAVADEYGELYTRLLRRGPNAYVTTTGRVRSREVGRVSSADRRASNQPNSSHGSGATA